MDYKVGSLADMISGSGSAKKKLKKNSSVKKDVKIKFENVDPIPDVQPTKKRKSDGMNGTTNSNKKKKKLNNGSPAVVPIVSPKRSKKWRSNIAEPGANDSPEKAKRPLDPEQESRTIFVGNLVKNVTKFNLRNLFNKFGKVETIRLRSAPIADPRVSKKVAVIKGEFHPDRTNINAYVRFESAESAHDALAANGTVVGGHTIRVDMSAGGGQNNSKSAVFVGNVKFTITEEDLRKVFESCGAIHSIRLVRDKRTGMGKGFAFINFVESEAVELALQLDGEELEKRPIRVTRCSAQTKLKVKKEKKKNAKVAATVQTFEKTGKKKSKLNNAPTPTIKSEPAASEFQGQETVDKKINKLKKQKLKKNKGEKKKKVMLHKLEVAPKSKNKKVKINDSM